MVSKDGTVGAIMAAAAAVLPPRESIDLALAYAAVAAHFLVTDSDGPKAVRFADSDRAGMITAQGVFDSLTSVCGRALAKDRERRQQGATDIINFADFLPKTEGR